MLYIVVELQKNSESQIANLVTSYTDRNQAESAFYAVLSAAAVSTIPKHACSLLTEDGLCIKSGVYEHESEATQ